MKKSALYETHIALKAKMTPFAGWEMPLYYSSIIQEHHAVRQHAGLFDLSHMGVITIFGPDSERFLDFLSTNKILGKETFSATYTAFCDLSGMTLDDLIIYKYSSSHFFLVINACNRDKDLEHLHQYSNSYDVTIIPNKEMGIMALQGPKAPFLAKKIFGEINFPNRMHFVEILYEGEPLALAATGYTGEKGFEIYIKNSHIQKLWDAFLSLSQDDGIQPVGLGARDTLRLEKAYALYGHELSPSISPLESVSAWTIKWQGRNFLGKEALLKLEKSGNLRYSYGIQLLEEGIAREGAPIFLEDQPIGKVTSGGFSPTLKKAIALILVESPLRIGDKVQVEIRGRRVLSEIISLPFA